jgi:hypothetical protein
MIEAFTADDLEEKFDGLPWEDNWDTLREELAESLDVRDRDRIADDLILAIESGTASTRQVETLVNLLFPAYARSKYLARDLSARQQRAVHAMYEAMKGGKRIFYGHFPCWGLPDSMREWKALAAGQEPAPVDDTLPLLALAQHPRRAIRPDHLKAGARVISRHFGAGTVNQVIAARDFTQLSIQFDEEGAKVLSLPSDGSAPQNVCR